jgi:septum formation protein
VLASTSPYRRELLQRLCLDFQSVSPEVDESPVTGESTSERVMRLSAAKARAGAAGLENALVIGSDQLAVCGDDALGKPGDHDSAVEQLLRLSGQRVTFLTGLCLHDARSHDSRVDLVPYHVIFRTLERQQIERYLRADQPYNCSGSFKSEGLGISLFESMHGEDPSALVGLPLIRLVSWLNDAGVPVP